MSNDVKVTARQYSFLDLVKKFWGEQWNAPDKGTYEFSNGRKFDSTDKTDHGIYNGGADD